MRLILTWCSLLHLKIAILSNYWILIVKIIVWVDESPYMVRGYYRLIFSLRAQTLGAFSRHDKFTASRKVFSTIRWCENCRAVLSMKSVFLLVSVQVHLRKNLHRYSQILHLDISVSLLPFLVFLSSFIIYRLVSLFHIFRPFMMLQIGD